MKKKYKEDRKLKVKTGGGVYSKDIFSIKNSLTPYIFKNLAVRVSVLSLLVSLALLGFIPITMAFLLPAVSHDTVSCCRRLPSLEYTPPP